MSRTTIATAIAAAALLGAPATAGAHVTLQPKEAPAGGFTRLDVRVPNERDEAGTTEVAVKMPPGIYSASYEPRPGWTVEITRRPLDTPAELHGREVTEEIDTVTFTGDGERGIIRPGQFVDFGLSLRMPDGEPGTELEFPATQTYEGGEVVRWIGPADADEPAPVVTLTGTGGHEPAAAGSEGEGEAEPDAAGVTADVDDGASQTLAVVALVVGALGLLAGVAALAAGRRRAAG